ncbi:hypothetical protein F5887DRAFT_1025705 [Amanita rubescens]|nr:hypothetical protein F5887DRAFT_1025705 [Amanita rubescens]
MRTKTAFSMIGGISPDGSACMVWTLPMVEGLSKASVFTTLDPRSSAIHAHIPHRYGSVQEYVQSVFDRDFHYMDQLLHKGTLSAHETEFRREISNGLSNLTPEEAFERVKSKRHDFIAHPYNCEYPFMLRHGDLAERHSEACSAFSLKLIPPESFLDWDFGGSHALPFADRGFEVCWLDLDDNIDAREEVADEIYRFKVTINQLAGAVPDDLKLNKLVYSTKLDVLNWEALEASGKNTCTSTCLDDSRVNAVGSVPDDTEVEDPQ